MDPNKSNPLFHALLSSGYQGYGDVSDKGEVTTGYNTLDNPFDSIIDFKAKDYIPDPSLLTPSEYIQSRQYDIEERDFERSKRLISGDTPLGKVFTPTDMETGFAYGARDSEGVPLDYVATDRSKAFNKDYLRNYYYHKVDKDAFPDYASWVEASGMGDLETGDFEFTWNPSVNIKGVTPDYTPKFKIGGKNVSLSLISDLTNLSEDEFMEKYKSKGITKKRYDNILQSEKYKVLMDYLPYFKREKQYHKRGLFDMPFGHVFTSDEDYEYK